MGKLAITVKITMDILHEMEISDDEDVMIISRSFSDSALEIASEKQITHIS